MSKRKLADKVKILNKIARESAILDMTCPICGLIDPTTSQSCPQCGSIILSGEVIPYETEK
jgi:predicted RNA-binding Zn-ribbon protein involved in translation (DUF1610 family)